MLRPAYISADARFRVSPALRLVHLSGAMSENASGEYENITVCEACECDEGVNLVVSVDTMLSTAFFISLIMITLTGIHFLLKLLRDCAKHPDTEPYSWFIGVPDEAQQRTRSPAKLSSSGVVVEGEVVKAEEDRGNQFQLQLRKVVRKNFMPQDSEGRQLHFFMVAKCEGQGFFNFCVLSVLEAVLSVTATANTSLEGDFEFVNDPGHVTETVAWLLTIANLLLLFFFVGEYRRMHAGTQLERAAPSKLGARSATPSPSDRPRSHTQEGHDALLVPAAPEGLDEAPQRHLRDLGELDRGLGVCPRRAEAAAAHRALHVALANHLHVPYAARRALG